MRKSLTMLLSGAALAAMAGAASAQTYGYPAYGQPGYAGRAPTATLYEQPNFQGRSVVVTGENGNLDGVGFNDRARSARFEGSWTVCADANFRGRCETLSGAVPYMPPGVTAAASSLRVAGGDWNGGWNGAPGQVPGWGGAETAVLFEYPNFQGRSVTVTRESGNLDSIGFNDRARSVQLTGTWKLCEDAGYRGRCETVTGAVPNLAYRNISGLSSLQVTGAYGGGYGTPPWGGGGYGQGGVPGTSVVFYPGPVPTTGYGAPYGSFGGTKRAADDFCRSMGNRSSVYYDSAGGILSDVLCRR
jgi:hypothetical protein